MLPNAVSVIAGTGKDPGRFSNILCGRSLDRQNPLAIEAGKDNQGMPAHDGSGGQIQARFSGNPRSLLASLLGLEASLARLSDSICHSYWSLVHNQKILFIGKNNEY